MFIFLIFLPVMIRFCCMLDIKEDRLQEILELRKKYIKSYGDIFVIILTLGGYILTLLTADIKNQPLYIQVLTGCFSVLIFAGSIFSIKNSCYSIERLYADIESISEKRHDFSILVFKDKSGKFVRQYLVKKDPRWHCWLFPYYKNSGSDANDLLQIARNMGFEDALFGKITEQDITKISVSAGHSKDYHHTYYEVLVDCSDKKFRETFKYRGNKYRWMSSEEMKAHKKTKLNNSDVIHYVEETF